MEFLKKNKVSIAVAVVVVLSLYMYFAYFRGTPSAELLTTTASPASEASQQLLATLNSLNTIKLDNSIFTDPVFLSLTSSGVQIPPQNVGRRNPFAPLGSQ